MNTSFIKYSCLYAYCLSIDNFTWYQSLVGDRGLWDSLLFKCLEKRAFGFLKIEVVDLASQIF